jgi:hypothetical protein
MFQIVVLLFVAFPATVTYDFGADGRLRISTIEGNKTGRWGRLGTALRGS